MARTLVFLYGAVAYAVFFVVFLYMIGFVGNLLVPKSIDSGIVLPFGQALLLNVLLIGLFGVQHSVMARPAFKSWWTKVIPQSMERSTYVLLASLILALIFWQWKPMPAVLWDVQEPWAVALLTAIFFLGWATVLYSSFLIDHFDLFGLRHVYLHLRSRPYTHPPFAVRSLYRFIRHPLMVGFLIALWAAPTMTVGRLVFALLMSGYILIGVAMEERDLARYLGGDYERYRLQTPKFVPVLVRRTSSESPGLGGGA
jgi:protein-S-isoprenylcysteine O-methyltransferase Ste14